MQIKTIKLFNITHKNNYFITFYSYKNNQIIIFFNFYQIIEKSDTNQILNLNNTKNI